MVIGLTVTCTAALNHQNWSFGLLSCLPLPIPNLSGLRLSSTGFAAWLSAVDHPDHHWCPVSGSRPNPRSIRPRSIRLHRLNCTGLPDWLLFGISAP
ncbi:hypothetical protein O181_054306 [Austropuccinia psidii MF-1]|uniref:Uncharacterized protein n=1 Tax=Austropuccinia psidii MF-1 TaxID=1389203 RepID=A0A9Q3E2B4_9BASI|nr:hypothetical protein [Austropuccinia psidii MF-1]